MSRSKVARRNKIIAGLQEAVAFVRGDAQEGVEQEPRPLTFAPVTGLDIGWATDLSQDALLKLLAVCVKLQQDAGFGDYIDLRQIPCSCCKAPGFNTGWGYSRYTCGGEMLNDEEGSWSKPCPGLAATPPRPAEAGEP